MKKGLRQRETKAGFAKSGWLKMKSSPRLVFSTSITRESYRFRKNRCDYRTKSKNIYGNLKVSVNVFGFQAWAGKGFQSRKNYRSLKGSVDATRSQAFSESGLQATKIYAGVKGCVNVISDYTRYTA
jgi:hypothetical protein